MTGVQTCALPISKINKKSIFFHISTDEVFGSIKKGFSAENSCYNPSSPYASSKASTDLIAISFIKTYKLPIKILNLCNNFGPYQFLEKYVPTVIFNLIFNKKAPVIKIDSFAKNFETKKWICDTSYSRSRYKFSTKYSIKEAIEDFINETKKEILKLNNNIKFVIVTDNIELAKKKFKGDIIVCNNKKIDLYFIY